MAIPYDTTPLDDAGFHLTWSAGELIACAPPIGDPEGAGLVYGQIFAIVDAGHGCYRLEHVTRCLEGEFPPMTGEAAVGALLDVWQQIDGAVRSAAYASRGAA